jgi:ferredoxin
VTLALTYEWCVRSRSPEADCRVCVDVCPAQAVTLDGARGSIDVSLDDCTSCGLCEAACPTDAFSGVFDVADFVAQSPTLVACGRDGLACVGALSAEDLVVLAFDNPLEVVANTCESGWTGHARARAAVEQARAFLAALGVNRTITLREGSTMLPPPAKQAEPDRRPLSGLFAPRALPADARRLRQPEHLDERALHEVKLTSRRERLLAALPPEVKPRFSSLPAESVGFTSSKLLDEPTCTGCLACVDACPTAALGAPARRDAIRFDSSRCVKCRLCHDVCEPGSLTASDELDVRAFLEFAPRTLVKLTMVECAQCGARFKADGKPRCAKCRGAAP